MTAVGGVFWFFPALAGLVLAKVGTRHGERKVATAAFWANSVAVIAWIVAVGSVGLLMILAAAFLP